MNKRIYIAIPLAGSKVVSPDAPMRLVNAGTPAAVRLHTTKNIYQIRPATTHEVATLVSGGTKVEEAGEDGNTEPLPGVAS